MIAHDALPTTAKNRINGIAVLGCSVAQLGVTMGVWHTSCNHFKDPFSWVTRKVDRFEFDSSRTSSHTHTVFLAIVFWVRTWVIMGVQSHLSRVTSPPKKPRADPFWQDSH